jgi:Xaa-Pro dipeptidase
MKRRDFLNTTAFSAGAFAISACSETNKNISALDALSSMTEDIEPVSVEERRERVSKAQNIMQKEGISALILDAGSSMIYFTGISWWPSERPMLAIIPADGTARYVCPAFEEDRLEEKINIGSKTYPWNEDENPYLRVLEALKDAGILKGKIGIEERLRFFIYNGIKKVAPKLDLVSGDAITIPCRIIKSETEIALMQRATDITTKAIQIGFESLKEGCDPSAFSSAVAAAHQKMGAIHAFASVNFAKASAFPHGSGRPQVLKKGDVVLVDCGCTVEGYNADMSRTIVFGAEPTSRQQEIWDLEKEAQAAGYAAAKIGNRLHEVDAAARKFITDAGFGPDYQLPGLPHRTGHGIGLDGHEWGNAVRGNNTIIEPGMCFSIEPNISIVGEFGIRLEDCVYITEDGPKWFSKPSPSIEQPFV